MAHPSKFAFADLSEFRERAIRHFITYPSRGRLPGMITDLTDQDKQALAYFDASIAILNRMGVLDSSKVQEAIPYVYTEVQEVNDEQTYGQSFTPQKK